MQAGVDDLDKASLALKQIDVEFTKYLDSFELWIKQPFYSPDHPFGNKMMQEANKDLINKINEIHE